MSHRFEDFLLFEEYGPHCSPAEPLRSTVTPESRSTLNSRVSPKSGLVAASSQISQQMGHSQITSYPSNPLSQNASVHSNPVPSQVPSYQPSPSTKVPPNGAYMFRVQMWTNNFDSGVQSMNHSAVSLPM